MKNTLLIISLIFLPFTFFAQEESVSVLDKIAQETCEHLSSEDLKDLSSDELTIKLGLYIIKLYSDYQEELNAEGFNIDFSEDGEGAEDFGEKVGINMIKFCPEVLMALAENEAFYDNDEYEVVEEFYAEGKLLKLEGEEFSNILIEDTEGRIQKFLWFANFAGSDKIMYSDSIEGLDVGITYKNTEYYSPKLKEYIIRKEILEIIYL